MIVLSTSRWPMPTKMFVCKAWLYLATQMSQESLWKAFKAGFSYVCAKVFNGFEAKHSTYFKKLWLYLVVCTATRTHCKNLRWWDAHRNAAPQQKIMQFMHLNAEFSERRLISQNLDLSINEIAITNNKSKYGIAITNPRTLAVFALMCNRWSCPNNKKMGQQPTCPF